MHYQRSLQEAPWRSHPLGHCFVPQIGKWPPGTENLIFLKPRLKGKTIFGGPVELMKSNPSPPSPPPFPLIKVKGPLLVGFKEGSGYTLHQRQLQEALQDRKCELYRRRHVYVCIYVYNCIFTYMYIEPGGESVGLAQCIICTPDVPRCSNESNPRGWCCVCYFEPDVLRCSWLETSPRAIKHASTQSKVCDTEVER